MMGNMHDVVLKKWVGGLNINGNLGILAIILKLVQKLKPMAEPIFNDLKAIGLKLGQSLANALTYLFPPEIWFALKNGVCGECGVWGSWRSG